MLEVFNNLFMSIAEQMGVALQNTAYSVNIKERLDFSCAVSSRAMARWWPTPRTCRVHLGSMDRAVETIIRENMGRSNRAMSTPSTRPITAARICRTSRCARLCSTRPGARSIHSALPHVLPSGTVHGQAFEKAHKSQFGFIDRSKQLVIEAVSVEAIGGGAKFKERASKTTRGKLPSPARRTKFFSGGKWHNAAVYTRDQLKPGHKVKGPAIVIEPHQTIVVEAGWQAALTAKNHLVLTRIAKLKRQSAVGTKADPVMLEVFNNLFMSIAEQMGVALQNTAYSVNIKERLDFSCAVFSGDGALVANAPHMPVHLGSMDRAVETIIRENKGKIKPGDVYAINAPITAARICPTSPSARRSSTRPSAKILFWVASRGHHADVGGISPGSMSPNATNHRTGRRLSRQFQAGRSRPLPRKGDQCRAHRRDVSRTQPDPEHQRPESADRRQRERRAGTGQDGGALLAAGRARLHEACAGQRRRKRAAGDRPAARCRILLRDGSGHRDQGQDHGRQEEARGDRRFHRHLAAAADQFQCARAGDARRRALCVPRHGGRRHPDERWVPAADQHRHSETKRC